jgi:hypothetical protein
MMDGFIVMPLVFTLCPLRDANVFIGSCDDDGEAVCYLCLDADVDEAGQPLRRDCTCRGHRCGICSPNLSS